MDPKLKEIDLKMSWIAVWLGIVMVGLVFLSIPGCVVYSNKQKTETTKAMVEHGFTAKDIYEARNGKEIVIQPDTPKTSTVTIVNGAPVNP